MTVKDTSIGVSGIQTLLRGLDLLHAVTAGTHDLEGLVAYTGLRRSAAHRLLTALVRQGYFLRPCLIELGFKAHRQLHLPSEAARRISQELRRNDA